MTLPELTKEFCSARIPAATGAQEWHWRNQCAAAMDAAYSEFCAENRCAPDLADLPAHPALHLDYMRRVVSALRAILRKSEA